MPKFIAAVVLLLCFILVPAELAAQLTVSPSSLPTYEGFSGGGNKYLLMRIFHPTEVAWTSSSSTSNGGNWLSLSPAAGIVPGGNVAAETDLVINTNLPPGTYRGTVVISVAQQGVTPVTLSLNMVLRAPGGTGTLSIAPPSLSVTAGRNAPSSVALEVSEQFAAAAAPAVRALSSAWRDEPAALRVPDENPSLATVNFNAAVAFHSGSNWLSVVPASGAATVGSPTIVRAIFNYSAIPAPGVYQATIVFTDSLGRTVNVPVTVTVPGTQARLLISHDALTFKNSAAAPTAAAPQTLQILTSGTAALNWTLSGLPAWLTASATSGSAGNTASTASAVTLRSNSAGLAAGSYQSLLTLRAAGVADELITATLLVVPSDGIASPAVQPSGLVFVSQGGASPQAQEVVVSNTGGRSFTFEVTGADPWVSVTPASGDTSNGPATVQVRVAPGSLAAGVHTARLRVNFSGGPEPQELEVTLVNAPGSPCTPSGITVAGTAAGAGLTVPISFPKALLAHAVDNCGNAVADASIVALVDGTSILMRSLGNGSYSGIWVPQSLQSDLPLIYRLSHLSLSSPVERAYKVSTATAAGGARLPVLPARAVVEGAGFTPGRPLAPGGIISLFGQRLANATGSSSTVPLSRDIGGVSVRIGDQNAPLYFVSPGQINAQVPFELAPGSTVPIVVNVGGQLTAPVHYTIAAAEPAIFRVGSDTAVLDSQFRLVNPQNPAVIGGTIQIYATGLGLTDVNVQTGNSWPGLSNVRVPVSVTIGGLPAQVAFQGLAPNFVGLYQVNAVVPSGVTPGSAVPLVITQNGVPSNPDSPVTIPVRAP